MKKCLLVCLLGISLLGCGSGNKISKTCTLDEDGQYIRMTIVGKDENATIDEVQVEIEMNYNLLGLDKDSPKEKREIAVGVLKQLYTGGKVSLKVNSKINEDSIQLNFKVNKDIEEWMKLTNLDEKGTNFDDLIFYFENLDYTCK